MATLAERCGEFIRDHGKALAQDRLDRKNQPRYSNDVRQSAQYYNSQQPASSGVSEEVVMAEISKILGECIAQGGKGFLNTPPAPDPTPARGTKPPQFDRDARPRQ